jgi:diguanylate cyclase (GGDEF)-like protein
VDEFEEINKTFGTVVRDKILKMVAQTILNNIRFFDCVGRWENDEMVVIVSNIEKGTLDLIANKPHLLIGASNISVDEKTVQTTISIGATQAMLGDTTESLIKRGHQLMKKSKETEKNTVSLG